MQYSTVQYSTVHCTVHYSIVPGKSLPVELRGVAGGADPGVRAELVEVEVGGRNGLQVKVPTKFRGYFLIFGVRGRHANNVIIVVMGGKCFV